MKKELKKQLSEIEAKIKKHGIIGVYSFDWKEMNDDVLDNWKICVKKLGGHLTELPEFEGTDTYGFVVSKQKIDKRLLVKRMKIENEIS